MQNRVFDAADIHFLEQQELHPSHQFLESIQVSVIIFQQFLHMI